MEIVWARKRKDLVKQFYLIITVLIQFKKYVDLLGPSSASTDTEPGEVLAMHDWDLAVCWSASEWDFDSGVREHGEIQIFGRKQRFLGSKEPCILE